MTVSGSQSSTTRSADATLDALVRELELAPTDDHNRTLVRHVHPPNWTNPTPSGRYNLLVVGAGTAGLVAAAGAGGMGAKVALVERHLFGGDCLNVGCVPSKAIIRSGHAAHDIRAAAAFGVQAAGEPEIDFAAVMTRVRKVRADIAPHDAVRRFADTYGLDIFLGDGHFAGPDRLEVGGHQLEFSRAVIATGARAAVPPIPGLADAGFLTNHTVFNLTDLPRRLAVVGGGPIGCELAQTFARLGSAVTVVEMSDQFLPREDRDAAEILHASMAADGVSMRLGTRLAKVATSAATKQLHLEGPEGAEILEVDEILLAVGRTPNVEGLGLEAAGVDFTRAGVTVDDTLRTSNPRIYASGDICQPYQFTHVADATSRMVVQNALFPGPKKRLSKLVIPWCTYTDPEIAHVGLTTRDAESKKIPIDTWTIPMADVDRALAEGDTSGFLRVHTAKGKDTILGATIVARRAGEMISEITTAISTGLGLGGFAGVIHPYPTQIEAIRKAADAYNHTRLTPFTTGILNAWFSWRR